MSHYVCTGGCGGVSETSGVCQDNACPLHNHELAECNCSDGKHEEALKKVHEEKEEELEDAFTSGK